MAGNATKAADNDNVARQNLPERTARNTVLAAAASDLHRKLPRGLRLEEVLCWKEQRVVARDWTLSWGGRVCQIDKRHAALSLVGQRVVVRETKDGWRQIQQRGDKLPWRELAVRPAPPPAAPALPEKAVPAAAGTKPLHPWRRWGIAAGENARRAGPSAPATDRVSLKEGSPQDVGGESERPPGRLAIRVRNKKRGRNAVNVGGCGGRGRRRGSTRGHSHCGKKGDILIEV